MITKIKITSAFVSTFLIFGWPLFSQASSVVRCEGVFDVVESAKSDARSFENLTKYEQLFTKSRGLGAYKLALGKDFEKSFERMLQKGDAHWFDSGAGNAFAVRQALDLPNGSRLKSTVVAYETAATSADRLKVISGRFLESIPDAEIMKSDLITDVFGPLAYSGQPHSVIQKYLNNLKPDREIYIFLGARHELYGQTNQVITAKGDILNLGQWLESLPDIKADLVKTKKEDDGTTYERWTIKITKLKETVEVPAVEMVSFKEGAPPTMTFKEVSNKGLSAVSTLQQKTRAIFVEQIKNVSASEFPDAFRGGEIRHPLISSIKSLKRDERWVNSSEMAPQILKGMQSKDYKFEDTTVFLGMAQKFIRWRASRINADKLNYTAMNDSNVLKDVKDVKLITDFYGDFVSSFTPDVILNRYVKSLANKGEIYIYLGKEYGGFGSESMVLTKNGNKVSLRQWLKQIPDLKTTLFRGGYHWAGGEWTFVKIEVPSKDKVTIPQLKLMGTTQSKEGMPAAFFEEI